ncbi:hypothetical protein JX265_010168 [Neoarthrinium moseri]|uniref:Uncharacterized protein n=1 Tax=Neoarthrinium moseri TaxID=1658444 RepID=A0A9P9WEF7_9PEZI|nr:uncharacterized protein JN550_007767 [Neoarthrinium moseri]KAI1844401.1 hypothetical protein JX266_009495 [Neoarthrinium moseri]KAI1859719.1 hypothetical protein JX265_010168 [Neoarthrinium moseri]KAI1866078.1 hypothetical protein JN550_007767 [Neoarthrinium moseri]
MFTCRIAIARETPVGVGGGNSVHGKAWCNWLYLKEASLRAGKAFRTGSSLYTKVAREANKTAPSTPGVARGWTDLQPLGPPEVASEDPEAVRSDSFKVPRD